MRTHLLAQLIYLTADGLALRRAQEVVLKEPALVFLDRFECIEVAKRAQDTFLCRHEPKT